MRDTITLIANTGLQFYKFEVEFDPLNFRKDKVQFIEDYDIGRERFWLDEVVKISKEDDIWARKSQLVKHNYIDRNGELAEDLDQSVLHVVREGSFYEIGNLNRTLKNFEEHWIPLPYFQQNNINEDRFGPTDWVRIYFKRIEDNRLQVVLLVDTTTTTTSDLLQATPRLSENANENRYFLPDNDDLILQYMDKKANCEWVEDYIQPFFVNENNALERPYLKHISSYLFFIRFLKKLNRLPNIQLIPDDKGRVDVDLVVDIGNSRTSAILFENPLEQDFNFNTVKELRVQDLEDPLLVYTKPFSTRLIFKEASFNTASSNINQNDKFIWPSPVRIGFESERTINQSNVNVLLRREDTSHYSSPKRYLWDDAPMQHQWHFHSNDIDAPPKPVYQKGISEQLKSDGSLCTDGLFGTVAAYSRQSLMTFVFLEIFSQAFSQVNSIEFRTEHGNPERRRRVKRILITCPTAMVKQEQVSLRKSAESAMWIINHQNKYLTRQEANRDIFQSDVKIIPSVRDLLITQENADRKEDWIYDEATSAQLVFVYSAIKEKFSGNADRFFNLFGKLNQKGDHNYKKRLTIASLDIGGGTTDLMICKYDYKSDDIIEVTPEPLYWESFKLAGDDLLKDLIQQCIIEGKADSQDFEDGYIGVIEHRLRKDGVPNVGGKLNGFFGKDSNRIGYKGQIMRTHFINQIALPVIFEYLKHANDAEECSLSYGDIFKQQPPSIELLDYFYQHFGFRFETLTWKISPRVISEIIEAKFSPLLRQISILISEFSADLIVLSGRPFSLKSMDRLFGRFAHLTPNRVFNLNDYWIGRWYPFADDNGYVEDSKTVVTVGGLIALMGGSLFKLGDFRINTKYLKERISSTADYVGPIKDDLIKKSILTPKNGEGTVTVPTLPFTLGFKSVDAEDCPARNMYAISTNEDRIAEVSERKAGADQEVKENEGDRLMQSIRARMPFTVRLSREYQEDKENIKIEEIIDAEGDDIAKNYLVLKPQTLEDARGYWLDTGEFKLNVRG